MNTNMIILSSINVLSVCLTHKDISATQALVNRDNKIYGNTVPDNSFSISKKNLKTTGQLVRADNAQYGNSFPAGAF